MGGSPESAAAPACRLCSEPLTQTFVDLGMSPPCEAFVPPDKADAPEVFLPLHVRVCTECLLVQLPNYVVPDDVFTEYAYFSSYSDSWVAHAEAYVETMVSTLHLGADSLVTEVASNDGYLLQHLVARGVPVLGVEPAANIAEVARAKGVRTEVRFLGDQTGKELAAEFGKADLVAANNVFAHVPDLHDFTAGLRQLVADDGLVTIEIPHLLRLVEGSQFDTIYHEHYSYLSLLTATRALAEHDLQIVDVDELGTHGGSLRYHARPGSGHPVTQRVHQVLADERAAGLHTLEGHAGFAAKAEKVRRDLLRFLLDAREAGKSVVGYGAPGKGNTLLNYTGVRSDLLAYTVDRNPYKHGRFLPGTHIPIFAPDRIAQTRPDYVLVLPWNLRTEISAQLAYVHEWGGRLVFPIPEVEIA